MPESAGIQEILEILRFSGRGLSILGKGLILLGKGFDKAGKKTAIKITQLRLAISHHHSATENSYNTISLKTLEKITGGELGICSVPTEDKTKLAEFFNMCKSYKINCAPLPDLNVGDGLTQIAFDPSQSHLMEAVQEKFNNQLLKDSKESLKGNQLAHGMSFEDYYNTADEKTRDAFIKETADEVEVKQNKETPSIALTANAFAGAREVYQKSGFQDYLSKPIIGDALEKMLISYLPKEKVQMDSKYESKKKKPSKVFKNSALQMASTGGSDISDIREDYADDKELYDAIGLLMHRANLE